MTICLVYAKHSHASFLLELPAPPAAKRGARILFDPVFSEHCADRAAAIASFYKTRRRTGVVGFSLDRHRRLTHSLPIAAPCQAEDLEGVDAVLISVSIFGRENYLSNSVSKL